MSFIERPFHPTTLLSIARATVKGRRRQYETRALLEDLRQSELRLQQMNDQLERRVEERTAQLQHAHDALVSQIAERERTEEQLRHMQKLELIGQLTGGVAHDFNNLLTAVLGNLELLRKRLPPDPSIERLIDGATQGAQRGASLTQRLLAFARRQALEPRPTDLAELVRGMGDLLRRSLGPPSPSISTCPPACRRPRPITNQIELALLNLAVNARDAMPDGGTLTIALACGDGERSPRPGAPAATCASAVSDTGRGMDPETLKRAIEPFFSTKEIGKGTGLGLSMIHGLALQLKGALRLPSELDHGTRAELWLPVANGSATVAAPEPAAEPGASERHATLLFVDDDFLISLSTAALLEDLGHTVIKAPSGTAALEVLKDDKPVDLMITDYAMPGMTGLQLAEAARQLRPDLPILLATGYADLPERASFELPRLSKPYSRSSSPSRSRRCSADHRSTGITRRTRSSRSHSPTQKNRPSQTPNSVWLNSGSPSRRWLAIAPPMRPVSSTAPNRAVRGQA